MPKNPQVIKTEPQKLSTYDYSQCYTLTLPDGDMRNILTRKAFVKPENYVYFLCKLDSKVLGWAILTKRLEKDRDDRYEIDVFVDPQHRKEGVGEFLVSCVRDEVGAATLNAYPFDLGGVHFFNKVHVQTHTGWDGGDIAEFQIKLHELKMELIKPFVPFLTGLLNQLAKLLENLHKHTPRIYGK